MFSAAGKTAAVATAANYIEDVFSTWLYTGNGSTQTITNGIDLSTKGGLVWIKSRASGSYNHQLVDTTRGSNKYINSNTTDAEATATNRLTAFNTDGFALGAASVVNEAPGTGYAATYASWTFRKQAKFFDVVTWTGNGNSSSRIISHSLESRPGCVIIKCLSTPTNWDALCRINDTNLAWMYLNTTASAGSAGGTPSFTTLGITSTGIDVAKIWLNSSSYPGAGGGNANGETYVAYLFAHDAGGFGLTGTDNVISCGSFTTDGSGNATVSLGYEPQWVLIKQTDGADSWYLNDNMRGMAVSGNQPNLSPNSSAAESAGGYNTYPNATGFTASVGIASKNYIYIAIRRGPMKTPTTGTSVYTGITRTGTGAAATITGSGFPPDLAIVERRQDHTGQYNVVVDRLRGATAWLGANSTEQEYINSNMVSSFNMDGISVGSEGSVNASSAPLINWMFRRAPGFFDVVCFTGSPVSVNHNLGVVPELIIAKSRQDGTGPDNWAVATTTVNYLSLNLTDASLGGGVSLSATATTFDATTVRTADNYFPGFGGVTAVAYLFASCPGVSKVGSYTGTGALQTVNCGFTGGARFVLIKRTDSTGDWYCWDSARGIVAGNDPYLLLNSTAAEVTNTDYVDTYSAGFEISSTAPAAINANGGTFVFLAIA